MKIEDDFLEQTAFDDLQNLIMSFNFNWQYSTIIDSCTSIKNEDNFQFVHVFYDDSVPRSPFLERLNPIIEKIQPISFWRIKANLRTRLSKIDEIPFHVDIEGIPEEKSKQWTTSIFYMNTTNGYTKFEDGTKVESVANRFVSFPANKKHTGTSCTDEKRKVVINFNYFK